MRFGRKDQQVQSPEPGRRTWERTERAGALGTEVVVPDVSGGHWAEETQWRLDFLLREAGAAARWEPERPQPRGIGAVLVSALQHRRCWVNISSWVLGCVCECVWGLSVVGMPPPRTVCPTCFQALASPCELLLHFGPPDTLSGSPLSTRACLLDPLCMLDNPPDSCPLPSKFLSPMLVLLTWCFLGFGHPQTELK